MIAAEMRPNPGYACLPMPIGALVPAASPKNKHRRWRATERRVEQAEQELAQLSGVAQSLRAAAACEERSNYRAIPEFKEKWEGITPVLRAHDLAPAQVTVKRLMDLPRVDRQEIEDFSFWFALWHPTHNAAGQI